MTYQTLFSQDVNTRRAGIPLIFVAPCAHLRKLVSASTAFSTSCAYDLRRKSSACGFITLVRAVAIASTSTVVRAPKPEWCLHTTHCPCTLLVAHVTSCQEAILPPGKYHCMVSHSLSAFHHVTLPQAAPVPPATPSSPYMPASSAPSPGPCRCSCSAVMEDALGTRRSYRERCWRSTHASSCRRGQYRCICFGGTQAVAGCEVCRPWVRLAGLGAGMYEIQEKGGWGGGGRQTILQVRVVSIRSEDKCAWCCTLNYS